MEWPVPRRHPPFHPGGAGQGGQPGDSDNRISWLDWERGAEIRWHGFRIGEPDWSHDSRSLAMHLRGNAPGGRAEDIFLMANAHWEAHDFELPHLDKGAWCDFVDKGRAGDEAIQELDALKPLLDSHRYRVESRGMAVLVANGAA